MYWSRNFLAVVFKKQEISQQACRMQDLASEFSKNFPGVIPPDPHSGRGRPPPAPSPSPAFGRKAGRRCWDPNLGPQLFSRGCALTAVFVLVENQKVTNTVHSNTSLNHVGSSVGDIYRHRGMMNKDHAQTVSVTPLETTASDSGKSSPTAALTAWYSNTMVNTYNTCPVAKHFSITQRHYSE